MLIEYLKTAGLAVLVAVTLIYTALDILMPVFVFLILMGYAGG